MRAEGVTTSWDFGWDPSLPRRAGFGALMRAVDFVFMNEPEFAMYARRLVTPDSIAIVKLGARGSRWVAADATLHAAATRVRAVDTTGAGDAFNAGFLYGFLRGGSPRACLEMGNYVGARSTKAAGGIDALPRRPARSAFVRARPARRSGNEPARP
jgi:sugar/nucleoside kinase (ribokinase family)